VRVSVKCQEHRSTFCFRILCIVELCVGLPILIYLSLTLDINLKICLWNGAGDCSAKRQGASGSCQRGAQRAVAFSLSSSGLSI
jgi:hypothetical protein